MKVLITNKDLGFCDGAVLEDAEVYSAVYGGYVGFYKGIKAVIGTEDGAIIVEDVGAEMDHKFC